MSRSAKRTNLHNNWQFAAKPWTVEGAQLGYSRLDWYAAEIPGCIHTDLMRHGILADPRVGMQEISAQWVDETTWIYRTEIDLSSLHHSRAVLIFNGLDTFAEIRLDGEIIGSSEDMFLPIECDVSRYINQGPKQLEIEFTPAAKEATIRRDNYLREQGERPDAAMCFERGWANKAQYQFGWDWGPRLVSCGIWKPVELLTFEARIVECFPYFRSTNEGEYELAIDWKIEGQPNTTYSLNIVSLDTQQSVEITCDEEGRSSGELVYSRMPMSAVPLGQKQAVVGELHSEGGQSLDKFQTFCGAPQFRLVQNADEIGESFQFVDVDTGIPLFAFGANWIPDSIFPSQITDEQIEARVQQAAAMGMNMLRVWGGGLYESDAFYEACLKKNILVWQDFPFACSYTPDDAAAQNRVTMQAAHQIKRLRRWPNLVLWCGNNENDVMVADGWGGKENQPNCYHGDKIYGEILPSLVAALDPLRNYLRSSPTGGEHPNSNSFGDQHFWEVWHGRGDWTYYAESNARFCSEFGFASAASLHAWNSVIALEHAPLESPAFHWHDKTLKPWSRFQEMVEYHYPKSVSSGDWIYYSQLNQRDAMQFALEQFRFSGRCAGALIWQLNDCWVGSSWALIDGIGCRKAAAHYFESQSRLPYATIEIQQGKARIRFCYGDESDNGSDTEIRILATSTLTGDVLQQLDWRLDEPTNDVQECIFDTSKLDPMSTAIVVLNRQRNGEMLLAWKFLAEPREMKLPSPGTIEITKQGTLKIIADRPVFDLYLTDETHPDMFSPNFVSLPLGGEIEVQVSEEPTRLRARSLSGIHRVEMD